MKVISVLHIDDDIDLLYIARHFLELGGRIKVDVVSSAIEGLEYLKRRKFDVIVSDYEMPDMTGIDLLKKLKDARGYDTFHHLYRTEGRGEYRGDKMRRRFLHAEGWFSKNAVRRSERSDRPCRTYETS